MGYTNAMLWKIIFIILTFENKLTRLGERVELLCVERIKLESE